MKNKKVFIIKGENEFEESEVFIDLPEPTTTTTTGQEPQEEEETQTTN